LNPGDITNWRSTAVCNDTLATVCVQSGLSKLLRYESVALKEDIDKFCVNLDVEIAPKALGDLLEAVIGAVYVDSQELDKISEIISRLIIEPYLKVQMTEIIVKT
jgi:dsRNA-specific ribonuclease